MKKIKVLHVIGSLRVGGAENVVMNYYRYISKEKFEIDFLVYGDKVEHYEDEIKESGNKVIHINSPNKGYKKFYSNVRKVIKENGPYQIVHSHTLFNTGLILKAAYAENIPLRIAHAHSERSVVRYSWFKNIYISFMKSFIKKYGNDWIACSRQAGEYLYGKTFFKEKGMIIKNAINTSNYVYNENQRKYIRKKYDIDDQYVIGHVGRFSKVKNHGFILEVFKTVLQYQKNMVLLLVGDGEQRTFIEEKIKSLGISDNVILTGAKTNVHDYMNAMDLLIFPSYYEGLGIVVVEAQAVGLKCVVSNAIPKEVDFTNNIKYLSLEDDLEIWASEIITSLQTNKRNENVKLPIDYSITYQIDTLQNVYLKGLNRN